MSGGRLTTHALDTARGCAAAGMHVEVSGPSGVVKHVTLDEHGRATLLEGDALTAGAYEILFFAGAYQSPLGGAAFFDKIPIRFIVSDAGAHYHVPLVLSPFGYSTYRGG
jgi:5-hydroxyisourate hydrolase